jgi:hypothetical protein
MIRDFREFEAGPDPFGKIWKVTFLWLQTAVSIRHADTVDVKFLLFDGSRTQEKVVALSHPELLELGRLEGRPVSDPWCSRLAAAHLRRMIETGEDMEKNVVTLGAGELRQAAASMEQAATRP